MSRPKGGTAVEWGRVVIPRPVSYTHLDVYKRQLENIPYMKTLYIFLTRSGTLLSNLVYHLTGAQYTHVSLSLIHI